MVVPNATIKPPANVHKILALAPHTALTRSIRSTVVWSTMWIKDVREDIPSEKAIPITRRTVNSHDHPAYVFDGKIHTYSSAVHHHTRLLRYVPRTSFGGMISDENPHNAYFECTDFEWQREFHPRKADISAVNTKPWLYSSWTSRHPRTRPKREWDSHKLEPPDKHLVCKQIPLVKQQDRSTRTNLQ